MRSPICCFFLLAALLTACSDSHRTGDDGGTARDGGTVGDDGGATCEIDCAPPPSGCNYEGRVRCDPPTCPMLVCEECLPCPRPPVGCAYTDACTCAGLVCDDVSCGAGAERFPDFDRTCATLEDCIEVRHGTDCCGSVRVMGIASTESTHFEAAETTCSGMFPACGCASGLVTADDETTNAGSSGGDPVLACLAGQCTTSFTLGGV